MKIKHNFYAGPGEYIDYIDTGCDVPTDYRQLPTLDAGVVDGAARFLHLCSNNTVVGTQWYRLPETTTALATDASSDLLARELNLDNVNLFYAHTQKNAGLAGVTMVAIRKSAMLEDESLPQILSYRPHIEKRSNFHTPPVFSIYVTNLMPKCLDHEIVRWKPNRLWR